MKRAFIEKVKTAIQEWAKLHPTVELASVEVYSTGFPDDFDVIVVANKGFENWRKIERQNDIADFIGKQLGDTIVTKIPVLHAITEEQHEKYEITHDAALV
jgi:acid stress-induced BolA-like protein IbaG/YrbA